MQKQYNIILATNIHAAVIIATVNLPKSWNLSQNRWKCGVRPPLTIVGKLTLKIFRMRSCLCMYVQLILLHSNSVYEDLACDVGWLTTRLSALSFGKSMHVVSASVRSPLNLCGLVDLHDLLLSY